jgi:hypothetical protein
MWRRCTPRRPAEASPPVPRTLCPRHPGGGRRKRLLMRPMPDDPVQKGPAISFQRDDSVFSPSPLRGGGWPSRERGSGQGSDASGRGAVVTQRRASHRTVAPFSRAPSGATLPSRGLRTHPSWAATRPQDRARVPSPVRERDRVRDQVCPEEARPVGVSMVGSILNLLIPHPNPLPLGRGGLSRSAASVGVSWRCVNIVAGRGGRGTRGAGRASPSRSGVSAGLRTGPQPPERRPAR